MTREMIVPEGQEWAPQMFKMAPGLRVGDHVYLSGVVVVPKDEGDAALEAGIEETFGMIEATLKAAGGSWDDAVDVTTFHVDLERQKEPFMRVKDRYIKGPHFAAWTAVGVTRLWGPEMVLEIKVTAVIPAPAS